MVTKRLQFILSSFPRKVYHFGDSAEIDGLNQKLAPATFALFAGLFAPSCGAAPGDAGRAGTDRQAADTTTGADVTNANEAKRRFQSLDEYLAFLETQSHLDGKWYREIRPGVYELQTGNLHLDGDTQKRIFTREELMRELGFTR